MNVRFSLFCFVSMALCMGSFSGMADDTPAAEPAAETAPAADAAEPKADAPKKEAKPAKPATAAKPAKEAKAPKAGKTAAKKIKKGGMEYVVEHPGRAKGKVAKNEMAVSVHYDGRLENGTQFDSSRKRGEPFTFKLGAHQVIAGWDVGVEGMKEGEKRTLYIPASMGYGERGVPGVIPANSKLIFDVELLEVKSN